MTSRDVLLSAFTGGEAPASAAACRHCGQSFLARSSQQKFCSDPCRVRYWKDRREESRKDAPPDSTPLSVLWAEQDRDRVRIEQDRLRRAVHAALRRAPSVREFQRAWKVWEAAK